jgi:hypothetical protein
MSEIAFLCSVVRRKPTLTFIASCPKALEMQEPNKAQRITPQMRHLAKTLPLLIKLFAE